MRRKQIISVALSVDEKRRLDDAVQRDRRTISDWVRLAITRELERTEKQT